MVKSQLQTDRQALESQLSQQSELKSVLEKVQKRTVEISEVVATQLRSREEELRRREQEMQRQERDLEQDEQVRLEIEEKQIEDQERKLQLQKDALLRLKQSQNQEITRLREHRQLTC